MRKIGLIGGMSWYTTALYYKHINEQIARRVGGVASAPMAIESFNFADLAQAKSDEDWKAIGKELTLAARRLVRSGATAVFICANSMHRVFDELEAKLDIPVIHIADCVGEKMKADGIATAALIGPRNVMTENWYRQRLVQHGVKLSPPNMARADEIDRIIYSELMRGEVKRDAQRTMKTFLTDIDKQGVKAVVLGGTELGMVVDTRANILPIYDSAIIHARAAVDWILEEDNVPSAPKGDAP